MSEELKKEFNSYLYIGEVLIQAGLIDEIEKFICYQGGQIYRVTSDAEARAIVENYKVSAIIIDQYLPQCSGLDFMRWLHSFARIPAIVIIMNQYSQDTDTVVALEAGAADAVYIDISARELAARIHASIRKYFHGGYDPIFNKNESVSFGNSGKKTPLYYNPESRRLYFSNTSRVVLNGKEAELLVLLATKHPDYLDREKISQSIFQQSWNPNDRRIDNLISRLRKIVDDNDADSASSAIETVRNEGYRLRISIALIQVERNISLAFSNGEIKKRTLL